MLNYEQALKTILEKVSVLPAEEKLLFNSTSQVTAEDVISEYTLPMSATAMPDGYAVHSEDIAGASRDNPVTLRIIETVKAGSLPKRPLKHGTAIRIMTGSIAPKSADCVVRFEDTDEPGSKSGPNPANPTEVKIYVSVKPGANLRQAGSTVKKGTLILPEGNPIGPAQISALTAIGKAHVKVYRRPVIAVIATGDELINLKRPLSPGKAYNCNGPAIAALVSHYGGKPQVLGIARDTKASLLAKMRKALTADAIITTGGVSMGDYDLVRAVIQEMGEVVFTRISMAPGASFAFGMINRPAGEAGKIPVFALSGPPVGCLNNFETLVRPAILKMMGFPTVNHPVIEAIAADPVSGKKPMSFVKWANLKRVDGYYQVSLNPPGETSMLAEMATATSMMIVPEGTEVQMGDSVQVLPLDWSRNFHASSSG